MGDHLARVSHECCAEPMSAAAQAAAARQQHSILSASRCTGGVQDLCRATPSDGSPTEVTAVESIQHKNESGSASSGRKATAPAIQGFGGVLCKIAEFGAGSNIIYAFLRSPESLKFASVKQRRGCGMGQQLQGNDTGSSRIRACCLQGCCQVFARAAESFFLFCVFWGTGVCEKNAHLQRKLAGRPPLPQNSVGVSPDSSGVQMAAE